MTSALTRADIAALTPELDGIADPWDAAGLLRLLRLLYRVGRTDLPLGRLFEGHVDALQIVARYGTAAQRAAAEEAAHGGGAFGVWNADQPGEPAVFADGQLSGAKAFASGAGLLSHALVPVDADGGRQLLLVDLTRTPPDIDRSWWRVSGMQRSETHLARWSGAPLEAEAMIGRPGDYTHEPWFSGGAVRFASVQAGGIAGVVDRTRDHLVAQGRDSDPLQRVRLADLYRAAQGAADAVANAAAAWNVDRVDETLAYVAAARSAVYAAGETVLTLSQAAVGVQAMFVDHPLNAALTDLAVYLRQPGPDLQRDRAGAAVAAGVLTPTL